MSHIPISSLIYGPFEENTGLKIRVPKPSPKTPLCAQFCTNNPDPADRQSPVLRQRADPDASAACGPAGVGRHMQHSCYQWQRPHLVCVISTPYRRGRTHGRQAGPRQAVRHVLGPERLGGCRLATARKRRASRPPASSHFQNWFPSSANWSSF